MNTKLDLMYRDASNYKASQSVVLAGEITAEQIAAIASKLDDGAFLIAHQVGLPTPSDAFSGNDNYPNDDIDHVFTTLVEFENARETDNELPAPEDFLTDEAPTMPLDIATLASRIASTSEWNVVAEWDRLNGCGIGYTPF
jgi:hypothetical protein